MQPDRIVIGSDVDERHLDKARLRHCRVALPRHDKFSGLACLDYLEADTHHAERAEVPLLLALDRKLGGLVKGKLAGYLSVLFLYVLYKPDCLSAVVHVKEYGVTLVLGDVHTFGEDAVPVAVERVVSQSYSIAHVCAIMIFAAKVRVKLLCSKKVCNGCTLLCNGCTLFLRTHHVFALLHSKSAKIIIDMTKAELENKRDLARTLYLSGKEQTEIAEMIGVSRVTISKWCTADGWKATRAAKTITRPELIKKLLLATNTLLDKVNESGDLALIDSLGDKLSKLTAAIDKLDKSQANVVAAIEVLTAFSKYLEFRAKTDPDVTLEFIKKVNKLQDGFLIESFNKGALVYYGD